MRNTGPLGITIVTILNKDVKLTEQEVSQKIRREATNFPEIKTYEGKY